jgi:hypothetical protein
MNIYQSNNASRMQPYVRDQSGFAVAIANTSSNPLHANSLNNRLIARNYFRSANIEIDNAVDENHDANSRPAQKLTNASSSSSSTSSSSSNLSIGPFFATSLDEEIKSAMNLDEFSSNSDCFHIQDYANSFIAQSTPCIPFEDRCRELDALLHAAYINQHDIFADKLNQQMRMTFKVEKNARNKSKDLEMQFDLLALAIDFNLLFDFVSLL